MPCDPSLSPARLHARSSPPSFPRISEHNGATCTSRTSGGVFRSHAYGIFRFSGNEQSGLRYSRRRANVKYAIKLSYTRRGREPPGNRYAIDNYTRTLTRAAWMEPLTIMPIIDRQECARSLNENTVVIRNQLPSYARCSCSNKIPSARSSSHDTESALSITVNASRMLL